VDAASAVGRVAPGGQELVHDGAAEAPCRIDGRDVDGRFLFYKVRATSPCSATPGPTCNGFRAQRAACP
jgi:hypothetical protein